MKWMKIRDFLIESSLSRVWQFVEDDGRSFSLISAFRSVPNKENEDAHKALKQEVRSLGYGFIELMGGYNAEDGFSSEKSLFIPSIPRSVALQLGSKYDQESILYKDDNSFGMIGTNKVYGFGTIISNFLKKAGKSNFELAKHAIQDFFSSLLKGKNKGRKFVFNMSSVSDSVDISTKFFLKEYYEPSVMLRMGNIKPYWRTILEEDVEEQ